MLVYFDHFVSVTVSHHSKLPLICEMIIFSIDWIVLTW